MTGKTKPNYGYNAGFFVPEVVLDDDDIEELKYICSTPGFVEAFTRVETPGFVEAVTDAIGFFKGHKINELESSTISEQRAALAELENLTYELTHAIKHMDSDTHEILLKALNYDSPDFLRSITDKHLSRLYAGVELARRAIESKEGPPSKLSERAFAGMLVNIFNHFEIEIRPYDDTGITGSDYFQVIKIGLTRGWPSQDEWPDKRKYLPLRPSAIRRLAKEYTP